MLGLTEDNALEYVFGYTIVNDVSAREVMAREKFQVKQPGDVITAEVTSVGRLVNRVVAGW